MVMEKIVCEVCGGNLFYERVDDGAVLVEINNNEVVEISNKSNGYTRVYCGNDGEHKVSIDLQDKVINLID